VTFAATASPRIAVLTQHRGQLIIITGKYKLKGAITVPVNSTYKIDFQEELYPASRGNKLEFLFGA
jgi:hypothetical protein